MNTLVGNDYLKKNLLPLIQNIKVKKTESFILKAIGLHEKGSSQSINIQFGNVIETFWNKTISDSDNPINLIENDNMIIIDNKKRQVDHFFRVNQNYFYLECKCNLDFDSEKIKASNQKVKDITKKYSEDDVDLTTGYFCPVLDVIPKKLKNKYLKADISIFGVKWMCETIKAPFTEEEYFNFLLKEVGSILIKKGI